MANKCVGGTLAAVQKAIKTGRISLTADGRIDSEAADRRWAANTDPAKKPSDASSAKVEVMPLLDGGQQPAPSEILRRPEWPEWSHMGPWPPPVTPKTEEDRGNVTDMDTFLAAKTRREWAEAEMAHLELLERRGQVVSADEVKQAAGAIGTMFSQQRRNVARQVSTHLVGKTDPMEIEKAILKAFDEADRVIADEIQNRFQDVVGDVRFSGVAV